MSRENESSQILFDAVARKQGRTFGLLVSAILSVHGAWPMIRGQGIEMRSGFLWGAVFLFSIALIHPVWLYYPTKIWIIFGRVFFKVQTTLILCLIFYGLMTPIGLMMRVFRKNNVKLTFGKAYSYWVCRNDPSIVMSRQF